MSEIYIESSWPFGYSPDPIVTNTDRPGETPEQNAARARDHIPDARMNLRDACKSAKDDQVGGNHYAKMPIQPIDFIHANGIGFMEGNAIKYLCRHKEKKGAEDIRKAMHYCRLILELEYGEKS